MEFEKERVHYVWDEELVGKKVFAADEVATLKRRVEEGSTKWRVIKESDANAYPFEVTNGDGIKEVFRFVYVLDDPPLTWKDLKIGDAIRKGNMTVMVTVIDARENTELHVYAAGWIEDDSLAEWVKVYDV